LKTLFHLTLAVVAAALLPLGQSLAAEDCLPCHREKTPAAVRQWEESAHAGARVGCAACHGVDHKAIEAGEAPVDADVCGKCHRKALLEHRTSRHGMGLHAGWGCTRNLPERDPAECRFCHRKGSEEPVSQVQCARFLKQSSEMGELGCNRCHQVENNCGSCHGNHFTDLAIVRDPASCAKCHMGPDHPQWEMWQTSQHGTLNGSMGPAVGPDCQRCHMPEGSHDVSKGLTAPPSGKPYPEEELPGRRAEMLRICTGCHAPAFARQELARGDAVRAQSLALVREAEAIVWDLADHGLLDPMPEERPPHPLRGEVLVTDGQMLYEDISRIERLLFKMKKFDFAKTIKGAYHQNPAYTHWYGNAELKMDLVDIRAEASRLRERGEGGKASEKKVAIPRGKKDEEALEALKRKFERGAISPEEYARRKALLLDAFLGEGKALP